MFVEGREDNSVNVVEVNSIWADFTYLECPECPEPTEWSGCDKGETEEFRTAYKCSEKTGYKCVPYEETRNCPTEEEPNEPVENGEKLSFWQRIWLAILNFLNKFKIR